MNLVFDIETIGFEFDSLSESQREYLTRFAEHEDDPLKREIQIEETKRYLSLYPLTAKIVAIGMLNTQTENTLVLYDGSAEDDLVVEEKNVRYKALNEESMLRDFWHYCEKANRVITFNGRCFDLPFVMMRSAILKVKPSRNFLRYRYEAKEHVDLLEQFTFYGTIKKFNLDFYCRAFGIESPKSKGITGMDVKELYKAGRIKEIAVYCGEDVKATYELYKRWSKFLDIK